MKLLAAFAAALLAVSGPALAAPAKPKPKPAAPSRVVLPTTVRPDRYDIVVRPDAANLKFHGQARIALTVLRATDRIVLNAADLKFGKVSLSGSNETPRIVLNDKEQTAAFVFARPLAPGKRTLSIDYDGQIFESPAGLFSLDYDTAEGKKRALFTQFENSDARRFAPMWDEPGVKSVFAITVEAPKGQMAVSNMPVAETRDGPGGLQSVRFADSPKMSSYLVFLALGDFERVHKMVGQIDVGVVVRKGDAAKAAFALDAAVKLLPYYNDYFDTPYPLPKLDLIAGPGRSQFFSAMENWGAIFYFDYAILLDPKTSTEGDKQQVFITIAHEMAHQWFGDLVTMAWWDDLWLNEGFASWMENKATDHFHPEWKVWLQTQGGQQGAMRLDARAGTHPIITPIPDVFAASNAFDTITYQKGQAVIRMLETYAGEDAFRQGVRDYIKGHAYGNTVTEDLWAALDKASKTPISPVAHDFTRQAGVPLVTADAVAGGVRLTQGRFSADTSQKIARTWRTPVVVEGLPTSWRGIVSAAAPTVVSAPAGASPVLNAGQTGYFRSNYSAALWTGVSSRFAALDPADQLGLIYDSAALGEAGVSPMSRLLDLSLGVTPASDPVVQLALAGQLEAWDFLYLPGAERDRWRAFVRARLSPLLVRLGSDAKAGEADNDVLLRGSLIRILGEMDDPGVIAEARRRFAASLKDPGSLTGSLRSAVLQIVAGHADAATWDQLHGLAKASKDPSDRARLYARLGESHEPALAKKALELALSGELSKTDAPTLIAAVSSVYPDEAYDFALAHRTQVEALLEPTSRVIFFTRLASSSRKAEMVGKLDTLAKNVPASTVGEVRKAQAAIQVRLGVMKARAPEIQTWLSRRG